MSKFGTEIDPDLLFTFFNEIGIVSQLSSAMLAAVLPDEVHPSHFAILNHLTRMGDGKTPVQIAGAMQVTKATMTHSLQVLSMRGFVRIEPSLTDARSKNVLLTDRGRVFRSDAIEAVVGKFQAIMTPELCEQMAMALPHLQTVRKVLDANR
jgi:DNA-binding MarR family transcriptional regulator